MTLYAELIQDGSLVVKADRKCLLNGTNNSYIEPGSSKQHNQDNAGLPGIMLVLHVSSLEIAIIQGNPESCWCCISATRLEIVII